MITNNGTIRDQEIYDQIRTPLRNTHAWHWQQQMLKHLETSCDSEYQLKALTNQLTSAINPGF